MATLLYQGHGSYRITAADGTVIYVDPYAGGGYDLPADLILVTHDHSDHNRIDLVKKNKGCEIFTWKEALRGGRFNSRTIRGVEIRPVRAENAHHDPACCVGFILRLDGISVYASGDTSTTGDMKNYAALHLDWALLPIDGIYNMGPEEAACAADLIGAAHSVPVHMKPGSLFDEAMAARFTAKTATIIRPGESVSM